MNLDLKSVISNEEFEDAPLTDDETLIAADEAEVADISDEIAVDNDQIDDFSEELDETIEDVEELEATQDDMEEALADPDYEGMDQVAVEQLNRRIARIATKRGFDVSATSGVFSKESFTGTASNRRRATEYAKEGLVDTIKAMWDRIKAAIKAMWEGVKKFWKEHVSTLGRLAKALSKIKQRIKDAKGQPDATANVTAPGSLQKAFPGKENISGKLASDFTGRQQDMLSSVVMLVDGVTADVNMIAGVVKSGKDVGGEINITRSNLAKLEGKIKLGSDSQPLVGGQYGTFNIKGGDSADISVELDWKDAKAATSGDRKLTISGKGELTSLIDDNIALIKDTEKFGGRFQKLQGEFDKATNALNAAIASMKSDDEDDFAKAIRVASRGFQELMRIVPKVNSRVVKLNVRCAQSAVAYTKVALSNYKA